MTPGIQRAIRIPADLHALIEQEAERLGPPWTFSSVAVNAMRAGLSDGRSHNPPPTPESLRAKRAMARPKGKR